MNKRLQKTIAVIAASAIMVSASAFGVSASSDVDYTINSTYSSVNWDTYKQYKTDLHSHSTASDGHATKTQTIEKHYKDGFDIQALSDHGTVDYGWDQSAGNKLVHIAVNFKNPIDPLEAFGTAENGNSYTYDGMYYTQYDADNKAIRPMMRVPFANEQNPTSFNNAHVTSWFADYGNNSVGGTSDYETVIKNINKLGGLCVINHPGEYTTARHARNFDVAYDTSTLKYNYIVKKYTRLLEKYPAVLGIDMNSKGDFRTRFDRKLWDKLLMNVIPTGRNVFGFATTDSHNLDIINSGYTMMCMPELTPDALKNAMAEGAFFACSYHNGSREELKAWIQELRAAGVGLDLADKLEESYNKILQEEITQKEQDTIHKFDITATVPKVTSVDVDDRADTITINTKDAYMVHWVADGKIIASGNTIDLDDYSDEIGSYVRAEIIGEGGVMYTQPFTLEYEGAPEAESSFFVDLGKPISLICDTIVHTLQIVMKATGILSIVWHFAVK